MSFILSSRRIEIFAAGQRRLEMIQMSTATQLPLALTHLLAYLTGIMSSVSCNDLPQRNIEAWTT